MSRDGILKNTLIIGLLSISIKILGIARELLIARNFGASNLTDGYFIASVFPTIIPIIIGGAFATAFLPVFTQKYKYSSIKNEHWHLMTLVLVTLLIILSFIVISISIYANQIVGLFINDHGSFKQLVVSLTRIMAPGIIIVGLFTFLSSLLSFYNVFVWPAIATLIMNLSTIILIIILSNSFGIKGVSIAILSGMFLELLFIIPTLFKIKMKFKFKPIKLQSSYKEFMILALPLILSNFLNNFYVFIDRIFISQLEAGQLSAINYAFKIFQVPIGIFIASLLTVIYPKLSKDSLEDIDKFANTLKYSLKLYGIVIIPISFWMISMKVSIVEVLFQRGDFNVNDTMMTSDALFYYCLGLIGSAGVLLLIKVFLALRDSKTPIYIVLVSTVVHLILAYVFVKGIGFKGLPFSYSIAMNINFLLMIFMLIKKHRIPIYFFSTFKWFCKVCIAAFITVGISYLITNAVSVNFTIIVLFISIILSVIFYLLIIKLMGLFKTLYSNHISE